MKGLLEATYEGNGVLRLDEELRGIHPQAKVKVMVLTPPNSAEFVVEDIGIEGLHQELQAFEAQYNMSSADFYRRFRQGEIDDARDFIVWAGLYEISLRLNLDKSSQDE